MRLSLAIVLAVLVGIAVGVGMAVWRMRQEPWNGSPTGSSPDSAVPKAAAAGTPAPKVVVDQEEFNFGTMAFGSERSHDFTFSNSGTAPLVLTAGPTTCRCTVSEVKDNKLMPGESFKVTVHWRGREVTSDYRQMVQIITNDAARPVVKLSVVGEVAVLLAAEPSELVFSQLSQDEPASGEVRLLCKERRRLEILDTKFSERDWAEFFEVSLRPLSAAELRGQKGVRSGVLMKITVKPGLPQGAFRQTIVLSTNLPSTPSISVDLEGTVGGDVTVAGEGWEASRGILSFGFVSSRTGAQRRLVLVVRGPYGKKVKFKPIQIEPSLIRVELGKTMPIGDGTATQTPLLIQIPKGSPPINCFGSDQGKLGQVVLETNDPRMPQLRIPVRFLVEE